MAREEYDEVNERFEFLSKQKEDLEKARGNLLRTISEIKRTARERFQSVFGQIQENFRKTFRTMFGGGKADLLLLDEEDVIESGIEIVAQPPGKNLQSISLMSGGEKALTAISLIFAIYLIKPSPFCILDEIDAPLDDINVGRFTRVLQQFTEKSQFLIITHNKRTMEMANMIYGVTMAQQGVSNIMSMNFETAHRHATQGQPVIPAETKSEPSEPEVAQEEMEPEEEQSTAILEEEIQDEPTPDESMELEEDVPRAKNGTKLEEVTLDDEMTHFHDEDFVPHKEEVLEEE